jgi:uridylate kinase
MSLRFKRVLLKLSGEALAGDGKFGLDYGIVLKICESIKKCVDLGVEMGIVVGGGNFWRGRTNAQMDRARADHIGMLATAMNALALADALEAQGVVVRVQTAITMQQIAEPYIRLRAIRHLEKERVVIFGCGTGNPFFTTDTAAALRAVEIDAEIFLKATNTDGVYDKDPNKFADAVRYDEISYSKFLNDDLKVMDATAASLCKDNGMPTLVFGLDDPHNIVRAVTGESIGTVVREPK